MAFVIVMAQAVPMKRGEKFGPNVSILGVSFKDQYKTLADVSDSIVTSYKEKISSFNKQLPVASKKDGTPVSEFLTTWSKNYADIVDEYKTAVDKMDAKISALQKHLGA